MPAVPSLPPRIRLVVLFGGRSAEHDVSCVSAREVIAALDPDRYEVVPVGIRRDGTWVLARAAAELLARGPATELPAALEPDGEALDPLPALRSGGESLPTVAFPVLHGPNGEDGTVQGLLELAGVPYVGAGVLGSALAMDKAKAKEVLVQAGLPQARWLAAPAWEVTPAWVEQVPARLGLPVFVKPANMGSSIGVSKVTDAAELPGAIEAALAHDEWVVVEEQVVGREIEVGVLGNESPEVSTVGEIEPGAEFYDYGDKYHDGLAKLLIPAPIPPAVAAEAGQLARAAYRALRVEVLARVDFFWEEHGRGLLVNEVNTMPGCTPTSMFPLLWADAGVPYGELLDRLVGHALARSSRRRR